MQIGNTSSDPGDHFAPDLSRNIQEIEEKLAHHIQQNDLEEADLLAKQLVWHKRDGWKAYALRGLVSFAQLYY